MWVVLLSEHEECVDSLMIDISTGAGFDRGRLPHQEIRVGATNGRKYRGCTKGEATVSQFTMCVWGWGGGGGGGGGGERCKEMLILSVVYHECSTICRFSLALFEAVDQCNDAVQITGKDSTIMVSAVTVSDFKLGRNYHFFVLSLM